MAHAWGIKLGSGGSAVEFCEKRGIIGVGWGDVDLDVVEADDEQRLRKHLGDVYGAGFPSGWPGALRRFVNLCAPGDYVAYYVPQRKSFVICEVAGPASKRTTEVEDDIDIWITREVTRLNEIPVVAFFAPLKGRVLGPRMSFWQLHDEAKR
jgi:predicted Mrr-cat superfamily restriction endonuclease